jgi:hypothetical protein
VIAGAVVSTLTVTVVVHSVNAVPSLISTVSRCTPGLG